MTGFWMVFQPSNFLKVKGNPIMMSFPKQMGACLVVGGAIVACSGVGLPLAVVFIVIGLVLMSGK
jgi:hypothetical protein